MATSLPDDAASAFTPRRVRPRPKLSLSPETRQAIVERIEEFYREGRAVRHEDYQRRLQRYAKYRQWTEGKTEPWVGASDVALPDLATASMALQDTLHNAFLSARPAIVSSSWEAGDDQKLREREQALDDLHDQQFFGPGRGEEVVVPGIVEQLVNDGVVTIYIFYAEDRRYASDVRTFDPLEESEHPRDRFLRIIRQEWKSPIFEQQDEEGWEWRVLQDDRDYDVRFSVDHEGGDVQMETRGWVNVHTGPAFVVKDYEDVLWPPRAANLQPPSPSNPGGSAWVILVDYPHVSEIEQLQRDGYYDLLTSEDLEAVRTSVEAQHGENEAQDQRDDFQGVSRTREPHDVGHKQLTRLQCFDLYDLEQNGIREDVVFWTLLEPRLLCKAKRMNEMFPSDPPRRPLAEGNLFPTKGRREGIGLLELAEGTHDFLKALLDQGVDAGTLTTMPWGFMRASSAMNSLERFEPQPGDLIPTPDPSNDVHFPQFNTSGQSFALNFFALGQQLQEKVTGFGDLQLGRVPIGRSSALRTLGGVQQILAQGEARPERILRRFYMIFRDIWSTMHQLNAHMLPDEVRIRLSGKTGAAANPFRTVRRDQIQGRYQFDFQANILNSSRQALQMSLQQIMGALLSPFAVELGIAGPEQIHRLMRAWVEAWGQDADQYTAEPPPELLKPRITVDEAIVSIFQMRAPEGLPAEGAAEHLARLAAFEQSDDFGMLSDGPQQMILWQGWKQTVERMGQEQAQRAELAQQAQEAATGIAPDGTPGPKPNGAALGPSGTPPVEANELLDETLPSNNRGGF